MGKTSACRRARAVISNQQRGKEKKGKKRRDQLFGGTGVKEKAHANQHDGVLEKKDGSCIVWVSKSVGKARLYGNESTSDHGVGEKRTEGSHLLGCMEIDGGLLSQKRGFGLSI